MIRCNNCGTDNLDGSEYCDECGMKLSAAILAQLPNSPQMANASASAPPLPGMPQMPPISRPPAPPMPPMGVGNPAIAQMSPPRPMAEVSPAAGFPGQPPVKGAYGPSTAPSIRPAGNEPMGAAPPMANAQAVYNNKPNSGRAKLIIQRGGTIGKEFMLTDSESNIGRWDADGGIFPDVDLDQDDPEAKVSRRHARIIHQNGQYVIEDLGSTNGTFINRGRRLLPGNRHPLTNNDEIIVGKTFLKFVMD